MTKKLSLRDTVEPKSDQLNYDDVVGNPITVNIVSMKAGSPEQPVVIVLEKHRDFKPCKSMRRVLIAAWGDKGKDWIGQSMTLYGDETVKFGGVEVGGIRISHMSGIAAGMTLKVAVSKGKRADYVVQALKGAE